MLFADWRCVRIGKLLLDRFFEVYKENEDESFPPVLFGAECFSGATSPDGLCCGLASVAGTESSRFCGGFQHHAPELTQGT